ncbi:MAG: GreA/GreB family elongation factor, partial [bacterium]|nr:GreA/GreB family elongation factor [Candidatus Kapabacteria bacterium]
IDRRLHWLKKRLESVTVVTPSQDRAGTVYFGAWVRLVSATGSEHSYRIVGPDEIDLDRGKISMDSPLGKALMRHNVGDEVMVKRPIGDLSYRILAAQYVPFDDDISNAESLDASIVGATDDDGDAELDELDEHDDVDEIEDDE